MKTTASWGNNILDSTDIETTDIESIFNFMKYSEKLEWLIEDIRAESDKKKRNELKKDLPYMISSVLKKPHRLAENLEKSNLMIFDLDGLTEQGLKDIRNKIYKDPYTFFFFVSPSGAGLKIGVKLSKYITNNSTYRYNYEVYKKELEKAYGIELDNTKDSVRACFLSHDPKQFFNEKALSVAVLMPPIEKKTDYKMDISEDEEIEKIRQLCLSCRSELVYEDWITCGLALATLGGIGKELFVVLSTGNGSKDSVRDIEYKFDTFSNSGSIGIGSFFHMMKKYNVEI